MTKGLNTGAKETNKDQATHVPEDPEIVSLGKGKYYVCPPVIVEGQEHFFVKASTALSANLWPLLGDYETHNVFVCDGRGEILDLTGLCHVDEIFDGPKWLYQLESE